MILICIKSGYRITKGKSYEAVTNVPLSPNFIKNKGLEHNWISDMNYRIINDDGTRTWEFKENFITIDEYREKQLTKILNGIT